MSLLVKGGITKLSELTIDADKDWAYKLIKALGDPVESSDAATKQYVDSVVQHVYEVEIERLLDTVYQNTTDKPLLVVVSIGFRITVIGTSMNGSTIAMVYCDATEDPTTYIGGTGLPVVSISDMLDQTNQVHTANLITFLVPPSYYYKIITDYSGDGDAPMLDSWVEYTLHQS